MNLEAIFSVAFLFITATMALGVIEGPRVACDRWPDSHTLDAFVRDIIRLEGARTDQEKVLALFVWNQRVMRHGYGYVEGATREVLLQTSLREDADQWRYGVIDPVKILNVYGEGWCDTRSRLFHALCHAAGLKSETVSVFDPKVRVWYRDDDGVERWHFFDPFRSWYVFTRDGSRIASYEELVTDPTLLTAPSKTSVPFSYTTEENRTWMFQEDGTLFPQNAHTSFKLLPGDYHRMDLSLRRGERLQLNWSAAGKYYGIYEDFREAHACTNGPHSHIFSGPGTEHTTFAKGGEQIIDPLNWPYVKNYYRPCDNPACPFAGRPVKWYGNGVLTYEPDLSSLARYRDGLYSWGSYRNVASKPAPAGVPGLRPQRADEESWVLFRVDSPYVLVDGTIDVRARRGAAGDRCTIQLSVDKGDTWRDVWSAEGLGEQRATVNIGQQPWKTNQSSVVSQYGLLVRVMMKAADPATTGVDALRITGDLELNMFTLPMLQPGHNRIRFAARHVDAGEALRVTFGWDDRAGAGRTDVRTIRVAHETYTIHTDAAAPDDITMRYLVLENVAAPLHH
jgi:hypothetical protein